MTYYLALASTAQQVTWASVPPPANGTLYVATHYPSDQTLWSAYTFSAGAFDIRGQSAATPEPGTIALLLGGLSPVILFAKCHSLFYNPTALRIILNIRQK